LLILSSHSLNVQIKTYFRKGSVFSTPSPPIVKPFTPSIVNRTPSHRPSTYHCRCRAVISFRNRRAIYPRRRAIHPPRRDQLTFIVAPSLVLIVVALSLIHPRRHVVIDSPSSSCNHHSLSSSQHFACLCSLVRSTFR